ncbi:MAG: bifunctional GNAT family N-acetyltransferase/carbon-nitrogen hydrolase family protein [Planctomycetes bacterium]|nr:bifunctional GNAT family N-acetyltransferase/carbon-nitrogen hydrolase family protein [Planctomycetota bacterium]
MSERCFPGMKPWTRAHIASQIEHFPEGQFAIEIDGRLVASAGALVVDFAEHEDWHNWKLISDNGFIRNHSLDGDTLYGIEMMVDPEFQGMRLSRRLYEARKRLVREHNLQRIIIGGRIPGYGAHAQTLSAREYVDAVLRKSLYDPVLTAQLANGFSLKRLIPNYMPDDKASCGYATFLEWSNVEHVPHRRRSYRRTELARICTVQYQLRRIADFADFAHQVEFFVDVAAEHRSDFLVFPELFTSQLLSLQGRERPGPAQRKLAEFTPAYLELLQKLSIKGNVNIIGGSMFVVEDDQLYNAAYLFRRDGTIERQLKLHVTQSERKWWGLSKGDRLDVFETDRGRIAILLSTDIEYPELARYAAREGADLLFVPFTCDERSSYLRVRTCALARAIENDVYVVTSGCVGNLPQVENIDVHYAQSGIYTPSDFSFPRDGVAAEASPNIETLVVSDVDLSILRRHRRVGVSQNWSDPRSDLYEVRYSWDEA